jgi:AAA family ATP:ADP antiporter
VYCMIGRLGASLFGFIGAGATLGQLVGSLLAVGLARLGPG